MIVTLWSLAHRYFGFARDGELYAFQALAKIQPGLNSDVYLANTSQEKYTIFSSLYSAFIRPLGLLHAELLLFSICLLIFAGAAGLLVRKLQDVDAAWLATGFVAISSGQYGSYGVFSYMETYLSARSMAQALIAVAVTCFVYGRRRTAMAIALCAMLVHPIMALPGVLLILCLWLPIRFAISGAIAGIVAALLLALIAVSTSSGAHHLTVMDAEWLEVVTQRSQFLFMQYWRPSDWELTARPFVCLTLAALVTDNLRLRSLAYVSMLIGIVGLTVAVIASCIGPVALLMQGQAWRWVWITDFMSVALVAPTALQMWKDPRVGPLCSVLLVSGWVWGDAGVDNMVFVDASLGLWLIRTRLTLRMGYILKWTAIAVLMVAVIWIGANFWTYVTNPSADGGRNPGFAARARELFGLGLASSLIATACYFFISRVRSPYLSIGFLIFALGALALVLPTSQRQGRVGTPTEIAEFSDWRSQIPTSSNVLQVPLANTAAFVWLTLNRPNYSSVDQSSGVVFSRETAMEIRRRSDVLLPLGRPNWRLKDLIDAKAKDPAQEPPKPIPLTPEALISVCSDPQLGFVIAKEDLDFERVTHHHVGLWNDWNLYDCEKVRLKSPRS